MSPLDQEIVRKKLGVISENLRALEPIRALTREAYLEDIYKRKATERLPQDRCHFCGGEVIEQRVTVTADISSTLGGFVDTDENK